jgi:U6 snRNA-associated Sm-like protein LSm8
MRRCGTLKFNVAAHFLIIVCLFSESVLIVTSDARILVGTLVGHDNVQNLILNEASEKVFSRDEPPETIDLGLYVVRGDTVCVIGDYNQTKLEEDVRISEPMEALQQQQS